MNYDLRFKNRVIELDSLIKILLKNRGIETEKETEEFLNPKLKNVTVDSVGIDRKQLKKAISRIKQAIENKEQIVVFGDYDVDGIGGTAILWETLNSMGAKVMPYIPHRIDEGYGLSIRGIENIKNQKSNLKNIKLIITVDNGIVANKAVDFANKNGIDVIITDHHVPSKNLPKALAVVHTTKLCGTGVAWLFAQQFKVQSSPARNASQPASQAGRGGQGASVAGGKFKVNEDNHLELVALATVADLVPLKGANRTLLKFGLEALKKTKRIGLLELFKEAGIDKSKIGVYEIGHVIAPRLNATGRLEYAMDSLRLICTTNPKRAEKLAREIGLTNKERQLLTIETTRHAIELVKNRKELGKLLVVVHESYPQGVIGLVAGKLVEEFYRPAIVISRGEKFSKASARSVKGFNMIEFIRTVSEFLVDAGGHPMAAGFTIETAKIPVLEKAFKNKIGKLLDGDILKRKLKIDCELPLSLIDNNLYDSLQKLAPFGMGNPEPTFVSRKVTVEDMRLVGAEDKHIKFRFKIYDSGFTIDGIGFGMGEMSSKIHIGDKLDIAYTIDENEWLSRRSLGEGGNGEKRLQLKIKDLVG